MKTEFSRVLVAAPSSMFVYITTISLNHPFAKEFLSLLMGSLTLPLGKTNRGMKYIFYSEHHSNVANSGKNAINISGM